MKIISFAWTTPALLARHKTCTRRDWNKEYAKRFMRGELAQAYNNSPRIGGKPVGIIMLTQSPYPEWSNDIPASDWKAEGFEYLTEIGATVHGLTPRQVWDDWKQRPRVLWVVRFELREVKI